MNSKDVTWPKTLYYQFVAASIDPVKTHFSKATLPDGEEVAVYELKKVVRVKKTITVDLETVHEGD